MRLTVPKAGTICCRKWRHTSTLGTPLVFLPTAMSPANLDGIKQGEKRSRAIAHAAEVDEPQVVEPSSPNAHQPAGKRRRIFVLPSWSDIPRWPSDKSPLMEMPLEIWDKVCFSTDMWPPIVQFIPCRFSALKAVWRSVHASHVHLLHATQLVLKVTRPHGHGRNL